MNNSAATIECGQYIGRAKLLLSCVSRGIQLGGSLADPVLKPLLEKAGSFSVRDRRFRAGLDVEGCRCDGRRKKFCRKLGITCPFFSPLGPPRAWEKRK
jgi:hypothetical protein